MAFSPASKPNKLNDTTLRFTRGMIAPNTTTATTLVKLWSRHQPKNGSRPVRFLDTADRVVRRIERAEEALKLIYKLPGGTDPIVAQALTREALAAIIDAGGSAKWLELMICEHPIDHGK